MKVLGECVALTVGDQQGPAVGRFTDISIFLFTGQLSNRSSLRSPAVPVPAWVCAGWGGRESHPRSALNSEFVKLSTVDILGQKVLCCGGCLCPACCETFSRIYPLDASSKLLTSCDNKKMSPSIARYLWTWPTGWELSCSSSLGRKPLLCSAKGGYLPSITPGGRVFF